MEKRLLIAIALSMLILLTWSAFLPKPQHVANKEVAVPNSKAGQLDPIKQAEPIEIPEDSEFTFSIDKTELVFIEPLAAIKQVVFKQYQDAKFNLKYGLMLGSAELDFKKVSSSSNTVAFVHKDKEKTITKKFIFSGSPYYFQLEINVQSESEQYLTLDLPLTLGTLDLASKDLDARYQSFVVATKEGTKHSSPRKPLDIQEIKFLSLRDRYFCIIAEQDVEIASGFTNTINRQERAIVLQPRQINLAPGQQKTLLFHIYLGPQELRMISAVQPDWASVINYGFFDIISQTLLKALELLYSLVHNWGLAILILSCLVYLLVFPLTLKQMRSMKEMQALQPKIEELRKAYKDNPQKLNKEIMELYREHKINPLGGCLPLILQMPVFFALFQALMRSVVLKGAPFLWIKDLSEPDRLIYPLPFSIPLLGNEFNILPILMAIGMFVQQKISMGSGSSGTADQQKMMTIIFPLIFGFIFYHMPSGLVLYWFINSSLMLMYQWRIRKTK